MSSDPSNGGRAPPANESPSRSSSQEMHRDAPPPPPPSMTTPPQTMYYPPPPGTGYPPQQPMPHQGYSPAYAAHPNDQYAQPHPYHYPAGPYYNNPPPTNYNKNVGGRAFFRCFIMCCCMLFTGFFVTSLVMALALHPKFPIYTVDSVSVTNFSITPTTLNANWSTSISIHNMNEKLTVLVSDYKLDLMHKNELLGVSFSPDFELSKNGVKQMDASPSLMGFPSPQWDIDSISKEKESGYIMFNLRITSMVAFKSSSVSTRNTVLLALCNNLQIVFQNNTGTGKLENGGKPIICQLYM